MEWVLLATAGGAAALAPAAGGWWWWWTRRRPWVELVAPGFPSGLLASRAVPGTPSRVATGDAVFDAAVHLDGDASTWLRAATPEVRVALPALVALGLELRDGAVRGRVAADGRAVVESALDRLRGELATAPDAGRRFASEPNPGVRRRLLEDGLDGDARDALLALAATDPDASVRLRRAALVGDLDALVAIVTDPAVAPGLRDRAFTSLREAIPADALAARLLSLDGSALARDRLASLPPETWVDARLRRVAERWDAEDVADELTAILHALPEHDGRERLRATLPLAPATVARAVIPRVPSRLLSREVVGEVERARPDLGVLLRTIHAARHTAVDGPDVRDAPTTFDGTPLAWSSAERRAAGVVAGRHVSASRGVGGTLFRLTGVPLAARLTLRVGPDGQPTSEVPGTPGSLSWFPRHVRDLVRDGLPPCDLLQVEDGELRLRTTPEVPDDVRRVLGFLGALADALDALGPLSDAQRIAAAFRAAEPGWVRRKLAAGALAADPALAAESLRDDDPEVRRIAGRHAPHPPTLVALVASRSLPLPIRSVALTDLHSLGDAAALSAAVAHAWDDEALVPQALTLTGAARLRDQWAAVARTIDRLAPPNAPTRLLEQDLVKKALFVLAALEEPASEKTLLRGTLSRDSAVRHAAIGALGAVGSATMLRALQSCADHHPADRPAIERAVARLRERVGSGGLALADAGGGALSVATGGGDLAESVPERVSEDG